MKTPVLVGAAVALLAGCLALWALWFWSLLVFFGWLDVPDRTPIVPIVVLAPIMALRLQRYGSQGRRAEDGRMRSPFLPEQEVHGILRAAMEPWLGASWAELKDRYDDRHNRWKDSVATLEGYRPVAVHAGIYAASYTFGGANVTYIDMMREEVIRGGAIAIAASLSTRHRLFPWLELEARERVEVAAGNRDVGPAAQVNEAAPPKAERRVIRSALVALPLAAAFSALAGAGAGAFIAAVQPQEKSNWLLVLLVPVSIAVDWAIVAMIGPCARAARVVVTIALIVGFSATYVLHPL